MTAPIRSMFEPYRVLLDYEALEDGFIDIIEDMNVPYSEIDVRGGMTNGNTQKLLSKSRERWARTFGVESLGKMLKATGTALVLVVDDERFAQAKADLMQRKRPRKPPNGSMRRPAWLFTRSKSLKMQVLRNRSLSPKQRKKIARKAARARWKRKSPPLVPPPADGLDRHATPVCD